MTTDELIAVATPLVGRPHLEQFAGSHGELRWWRDAAEAMASEMTAAKYLLSVVADAPLKLEIATQTIAELKRRLADSEAALAWLEKRIRETKTGIS